MRHYIDHVMAVLSFEPAAMKRLGGPPCSYVGHPLSERVAAVRPNADEAKQRESSPPIVFFMPGSRAGEIARIMPVFRQVRRRFPNAPAPAGFVLLPWRRSLAA